MLAPFGWVTPSAGDLALLALLGMVAMVAHVCVNRSLKLAPASTVVPYQYTTIVWAVLFGYLVFGDVPDACDAGRRRDHHRGRPVHLPARAGACPPRSSFSEPPP